MLEDSCRGTSTLADVSTKIVNKLTIYKAIVIGSRNSRMISDWLLGPITGL